MKFGNLHFLWFLWFIPGVIVFYYWAFKRKETLINRFVSKELRDRLLAGFLPKRQRLKALFMILVIVFAILALIRPKWGFHWEEVKRKGVDIIVALDVSTSMLAEDVSPNRLERAKREIIDLINILQGDRLGLVAFAGVSFLQSPLTLDYGAVRIFLDDLDTELIPIPGTAIAQSMETAIKAFDQKDKKSRVLILITDGEDHQGDPVEIAKKASQQGIKIYTVGIGNLEGAPIPDKNRGGFKKDRNGNLILTKLDESTLQKIALNTGGSYVRSVTGDMDLEKIYEDITKKIEDKELKSGKRQRFEERFQWPLFLALLFLIFEFFIWERRAKVLILLLMFTFSTNVTAGIQDAQSNYKSGNYKDALKNYLDEQIEDPNNLDLKYNTANTYYKMKDYENAYKLFQSTAINGDQKMSQKSFYNLGNTAYRMGKLQESIDFYKRAIDLDPNDEDAKFNLEFVRKELKKRIEENKKRQQKQKQQQNKQCQNPQNQDQKQDQKKDQQQQKQQAKKEESKKKEEEKKQAAKKKDEKENKPQQAMARENKKKDDKKDKMSKQEAMRWLRNLDENRKKFLKRKMRGRGQYQVEKDW